MPDVGEAVVAASGGGAHVSLDALGHSATAAGSILSLRRRGRHVQVGLLAGEHARPALPMERVIAHELRVLGSHGMPAHRYPALLGMVADGRLAPERLLGRTISLEASIEALMSMDRTSGPGVTVITDLRAPVPRWIAGGGELPSVPSPPEEST
jgi:alcohol dehydrogenase